MKTREDILSLAVPEGWQLVPIEPTEEMLYKAGHYQMRTGAYRAMDLATYSTMLAAAPTPPAAEAQGQEPVAWRDPSTAVKDGTMVRLLVRPGASKDDGWTPFEDSTEPYQTIGFNPLENTGEDEWQFAGWDWNHDRFTDGHGEVIGWLPFGSAPTPPAAEAPGHWRVKDYADGWCWYRTEKEARESDEAVNGATVEFIAEAPGQEPVAVKPIGYQRPEDVGKSNFWCAQQQNSYYRVPVYAAPPTYADAEAKGWRATDDWTVSQSEHAARILTNLGLVSDASLDPYVDRRRDNIAKELAASFIEGRNAGRDEAANLLGELRAGYSRDAARARRADARATLIDMGAALDRAAAAIRSLASPAPKEQGQ